MTWQPIETAPKDGTWFMAWDGEEVLPICWVDDLNSWEPSYRGWACADKYWGGTLYEGYNEVKRQPTHWQVTLEPPVPD